MSARLILIRHGETAWSLAGRHTGKTDLPLTAEGERRAGLLRSALAGLTFRCVFTSPRQRARQTCALAGFAEVAQVIPELCEWDYGDDEGRTTAEIRTQRSGWNVFRDGCPHGESPRDVSRRADRVLEQLRSGGGDVALFSHAHFLRALAVRWIGLPIECGRNLALDAAAVSVLGYEPHDREGPVIALWNGGPSSVFSSGITQKE